MQNPFVVRHGVGNPAVFCPFQAERHRFGGGQFPWFLSHLIRQYASPPAALPFPFLFLFSFHIPPFVMAFNGPLSCTFRSSMRPVDLQRVCSETNTSKIYARSAAAQFRCFTFSTLGQNGSRGLGSPRKSRVWISKRYASKARHPLGEIF